MMIILNTVLNEECSEICGEFYPDCDYCPIVGVCDAPIDKSDIQRWSEEMNQAAKAWMSKRKEKLHDEKW